MSGIFSKIGKKLDEVATSATEVVKDVAENTTVVVKGAINPRKYHLKIGELEHTGTEDEIFEFLKEKEFLKEIEDENN